MPRSCQTDHFGLGLSHPLPVAVDGGVAGDEVSNVLLLVGVEGEPLLLLWVRGPHAEGDGVLHDVYRHTLQQFVAVLHHDLRGGELGTTESTQSQ